jgi:hypothetical protein
MTTSIVNKLISGPVLASAAFLLSTGSALAAEHADDAQTQARELLDRTASRAAPVARSIIAATGTPQAGLDPQEQARRLILGTPALHSKATSSSGAARIRGPYPDAQTLAKRMITGGAPG